MRVGDVVRLIPDGETLRISHMVKKCARMGAPGCDCECDDCYQATWLNVSETMWEGKAEDTPLKMADKVVTEIKADVVYELTPRTRQIKSISGRTVALVVKG